jgi:competence protein ComFC
MQKPNILKAFKLQSYQIKDSIQHLIYPNVCIICEKEVLNHTINVCPFCELDFNYTYFESYDGPTVLDKLFWGRVKIDRTFSLLFFEKNKAAQPILHALKYKSRKEVGIQMGKIIGVKIATNFPKLDGLIPVPIHPKKKFIRGFNQSELIAKGISEIINVPVFNNLVIKKDNTKSQTKMGKNLRWINAQEQYKWDKSKLQKFRHIAIVDDVVTTGATIESISKSILAEFKEIKISVISLALTK